MKTLLIVCDGLGDRLTNGKTPLEAASTPNMDRLASKGICGIMDTVQAGIRPGSDTSHLSLFGYDPFTTYTGRGPFEAHGAGIDLKCGDVAFRANFASMKDGKVIDRRAGRDEEGLEELSKTLEGMVIDGVEVLFKRGKGHRAVIVLRGEGLSSRISDTDPEDTNVAPNKSKPLDDDPKSRKTAEVLNKFTEKAADILSKNDANKKRIAAGKLPANMVLARGSGIEPDIRPFREKYGLSAACVTGTTLIKGVCRSLGMEVIEVPGATGHVDSAIGKKTDAAIKALEAHDFVFLHIKGTDEASHDGKFDEKKGMIERVDKEVIGPILDKVDAEKTTVVLTADHSTPIGIKQHSADPVPIAIIGDVRTDDVKKFDERSCARGGLNRICGRNLMDILLDLSNRSKLFGA
ncbi:MAG: 2,3-bisphosphoglycerate-independent phosphoglycerate mutase [Candidatus Altiarchaeota archaeon]|nr:2,3-bisphosphoglycerate-independent phosphoglycerate mutase [Candidatus Altiarchaeota archaeon]